MSAWMSRTKRFSYFVAWFDGIRIIVRKMRKKEVAFMARDRTWVGDGTAAAYAPERLTLASEQRASGCLFW
jgi:hypothetical protein